MHYFSRRIAVVLLVVSALASLFSFAPSIAAQETRDRRAANEKEEKTRPAWPTENGSVVKRASNTDESKLSNEPIMRIALSTDTRAVSISTTAQLLNASELNSAPQPLETARVRIESRLLSPLRQSNDRPYEVELARSVSREDADRLIESVHNTTGESPQAIADSSGKWRVIIVKQSGEEAEAVSAKLEDAGFEVVTSFKTPMGENNSQGASDFQHRRRCARAFQRETLSRQD